MKTPSISLCIPIYNGARYLRECLDSAVGQDFADMEIVLVDDGSGDGSVEIAKQYVECDVRIRLYQNERNLGLVGNWNRCVELARGEWIKFLFQDDALAPECLTAFARRMDPRIPILFCRRRIVFEGDIDEAIIRHYESLPSVESLFPGAEYVGSPEVVDTMLLKTRQNFLGEPTACMLHRSVFERFGTFDADLVQFCDFEYWIRVGIHTGIAYLPHTLASFRFHGSSASASNRKRFRSEYLDGLLILNRWSRSPAYRPLRRRARQLRLNLKKKLAAQSWWLEQYVRELGREDPEIPQQWEEMKRRYPELTQSPYLWPHRIKHWLDNTLLWRLKTS
ncbi:glycosyltransferase family 2 protein [Methylocaldum sp. MU1018]